MPAANVEKPKRKFCICLAVSRKKYSGLGKSPAGVEEIIQSVIARIPPPTDNANKPTRALILILYTTIIKASSLPCGLWTAN